MQKKIALIAGGDSSELVISLRTAAVVAKHLDKKKYAVYVIKLIGKDWILKLDGKEYPVDKNDFSVLIDGNKINFDGAFIAIHGTPGEDGKLQGYFDLIKMPYTTCGQLAAALTFSKWTCNTLLKQIGVSCASSYIIRDSSDKNYDKIISACGLPCFVKPNNAGSSFGVTKVLEAKELPAAIEKAFEHDKEVLVESFIEGTEITCGAYKQGDQIVVLPITEIVSKGAFFDFEAKYEGASEEITPARISEELREKVGEITRFVYEQLNLKGVVRIDYIIKKDTPYLIEVNTVPGMSEESIVPQQARAAGMDLKEFYTILLEEALA